jgi:hypothetical protein
MSATLAESIARQRDALKTLLREPLAQTAQACSETWHDREALNALLSAALAQQSICKYMYALDTQAIQVSDTLGRDGAVVPDFGRNRADRPYMNERVPSEGFLLSQAYISLRARRPSLTAIQIVRDASGRVLGFVGADFDLRNLPLTSKLYDEPTHWRQLRGDPAIRGSVFQQTRSESQVDSNIDTVMSVLEELMTSHGVYHVMLHFSSSRAVIWLFDDPYRYRLLDIAALTDPSICLAYPERAYPADALVPREKIRAVLDSLRDLRYMDDMFYLRTGTLNVFNGVVGLTFSCDGSHYLPWDEFISKGYDFWASGKLMG